MKKQRGDTIIEVTIAITIFCMISVLSISLMNGGVSNAQAALELTMARNEIDAQAEAIRFIHNSYLSERELPLEKQQYRKLWLRLTRGESSSLFSPNGSNIVFNGMAQAPQDIPRLTVDRCSDIYEGDGNKISNLKAFVVNTRLLEPSGKSNDYYTNLFGDSDPANPTTIDYDKLMKGVIIDSSRAEDKNKFVEAPLYPRLIFTRSDSTGNDSGKKLDESATDKPLLKVARAEGIWVYSVRDTGIQNKVPQYYDFHIRTCWYAPGRSVPSTIGTIIRLYNPEIIEKAGE